MRISSLPAQDGFHMPAEFEPQDGVLLVWPTRPGSWGKNPRAAQNAFCEIMRAASRSERVFLAVDHGHCSEALERAGAFAALLEIPSNDAWARDIGPTFVTNGTEARGISWRFNAWGQKHEPYDADDALAARVLAIASVKMV